MNRRFKKRLPRRGNPILPLPPPDYMTDMRGNLLVLGDRIRMARFPRGIIEGVIMRRPERRITKLVGHPGQEFVDLCILADDGTKWECKPDVAEKIPHPDVATAEEKRTA